MEKEKEKGFVVKYESRDGQEITLTFDLARKYLVQGRKELVTEQELMFFLGTCKAKGLNPFKRDVYLIKYDQNPAAIVTSVDYFRSRAIAQPNCVGWKKGIIVRNKQGEVKYSSGLLLDEETLLGGWFEAQPEGWREPFKLEVNLKGYIKKTSDGRTTKFWQEENQPTMIAKVAESQGLRTLWPDEFQGIYEEDEIKRHEPIPVEFEKMTEERVEKAEKAFSEKLPPDIDRKALNVYLSEVAEANNCSVDDVKSDATEDMEAFLKAFDVWKKPKAQRGRPLKQTTEKEKEEKPNITTPPPSAEKEKRFDPIANQEDFESLDEMGQIEALKELAATSDYKLPGKLADLDNEETRLEHYQKMKAMSKSS